jgi:4'-phosphopantetheinyl transferase
MPIHNGSPGRPATCLPAAARSVPGDGEIHLWRIDARLHGPDASVLDPAERARAGAFVDGGQGRRFAVFRGALRTILGTYLGLPAAALPLDAAPGGKPRLRPGTGPAPAFNLTHAEDFGLLAVAGRPVGVDLETAAAARFGARLAPRILSPIERAHYDALPPAAQAGALLRFWTRKEAYLKATGEGLALAPSAVSVDAGETARLIGVEGRPEEAVRWALLHLAPWPGTVGALAVAAGPVPPRLAWFDWSPPSAEADAAQGGAAP